MEFIRPRHPRYGTYYYDAPSFGGYGLVDPFQAIQREREARERAEQIALLRAQEARRQRQLELLRREELERQRVFAEVQSHLAIEEQRRRHAYRQQRARPSPRGYYVVVESPDATRNRRDPKVLNSAAAVIQRAYRAHKAVEQGKHEVDRLRGEFDQLKSEFVAPESPVLTPQGTFAYVAANTPIHAFENALTKLLTRLDSIDSKGDARVRSVRKALVLDVESELAKLDSLRIAYSQAMDVEAKEAVNEAVESKEEAKRSVEDDEVMSETETVVEGGEVDAATTALASEIQSSATIDAEPASESPITTPAESARIDIPIDWHSDNDAAMSTGGEASSTDAPVAPSSPEVEGFVVL